MTEKETNLVLMVIDEDVCIGAGQCEMLEEETFLLDDDTVIAGVIGTAMLPVDRAEIVVETCPSQAISFVDPASAGPTGEGE